MSSGYGADEEVDLTLRGWASACSPTSGMRSFNRFADVTTLAPNTSLDRKSFISNHAELLNLCNHPELAPLHGALSGKNPVVQPLTPIFSLSKTNLHADVLGVPTEQYVDGMPELPWSERKQEKLLWRGSNTGAHYDATTTWRTTQRIRLLRLGNFASPDEVEDGITFLPAPKSMKGQAISKMAETIPWRVANQHYMDLAFTGSPLRMLAKVPDVMLITRIECDDDDGTCDQLREEYRWTDPMTHEEALDYRYVVDVDGNAWSARFKRLLTSGSLIFKSTIMRKSNYSSSFPHSLLHLMLQFAVIRPFADQRYS